MAAFHALSIGFDIYCANVPTAKAMSGQAVLDTHNSWLTNSWHFLAVMGMDAREAGGSRIHMKGTVTGLVKGEGAVYRTPASRS